MTAAGLAAAIAAWRQASARYIGFPASQPSTVSSVAQGGLVGLAGGAAILAGG